jgi:hypothetical protein
MDGRRGKWTIGCRRRSYVHGIIQSERGREKERLCVKEKEEWRYELWVQFTD